MTVVGSIRLDLTTNNGAYSVDLTTGNNCSVKRVINNPVVVFSIPKGPFHDPDEETTSNQVVINLGMLTDRFILNFDLTDGIGASSKYRSLVMMAMWNPMLGGATSDDNLVQFTYGDKTYTVTVEQFDAQTRPGEFGLLRDCQLSLIYTNKMSYGLSDDL